MTDTRFHAIVTDLVGTPTELLTSDGTVAWQQHTTLWGVPTTDPLDSAVDCANAETPSAQVMLDVGTRQDAAESITSAGVEVESIRSVDRFGQ